MANLQHTEVSEKAVVAQAVGPGLIRKLATLAIASAPSLNDRWYMFRLPRCQLVGGLIMGREIDTNGSPTLKLDVGVLGGPTLLGTTISGGTFAQTKIHGGGVVIGSEALGEHVVGDGAKNFMQHLNKFVDGPVDLLDSENIIAITVAAVAATFAAGNITLQLDYNEKGRS